MSDAPHSKAHLEILRLEEEIAASEARGYDDGYKAGLAAGSSVAEEVTRDCEARGAARAVEQCRRLAEEVDRDWLGEVVRCAWVMWAREQPHPKPAHLVPWEELNEGDKEADRRIGSMVVQAFAASLSVGSTAGELLARYRPAPPSVVSALRAAVEAFPDEPDGGGEK